MGQLDLIEKKMLSNKIVFAEIANYALCNKKDIIKPEDLYPVNPNTEEKKNGKYQGRQRDVLMEWRVSGVVKAIIGIENQSQVDIKMPQRKHNYDDAQYNLLYEKDPKDVPPVKTIVLYYGINKRWDGRKTICNYEPAFNNREEKLIVIELGFLSKKDRDYFKTDIGIIAEFLYRQRRKQKYEWKNKVMYAPVATLSLLDELSGSKEFSILYKEKKIKRRGPVIMDETLANMIKEWETKGMKIGRTEGRNEERKRLARTLHKKGISKSIIADAVGIKEEDFESWLELKKV